MAHSPDHVDDDVDRRASPRRRAPPSPIPDRPPDASPSADAVKAAAEFDLPALLRGVVRACCHLAGAGYGVLTVMGPGGQAIEVGYAGIDTWSRPHIAASYRTAASVRLVTQLTALPEDDLQLPGPRLFLNVPVHLRGEVVGHLGLGAKNDRTGFDDDDEAVAASLAAVAGNGVDLATAIHLHERHLCLTDGRGDADAIVRALFCLGLELHRLTTGIVRAGDRADMTTTVDTIDQAIRQIRAAVFEP